MTYVHRRILQSNADGKGSEVNEAEFVANTGPIILLGEPGAGKSETATELAKLLGTKVINAEYLISQSSRLPSDLAAVVVDSIDEVMVGNQKDPIAAILDYFHAHNINTFILTCRAMDWKQATSNQKIRNRFAISPTVGHLQPLNDSEIAAMVAAISEGDLDGASFVADAEKRGGTEFARNPQSLKMLVDAIRESGWPNTKFDLYEASCRQMAGEVNTIHQSLDAVRPTPERILGAAGFIFAQLLMSGKRGVAIDGQSDPYFPRSAELYGDHVSIEEIQAAIRSRLVRASSASTVEPCHRTVAEFLAARWLAKAITRGVSLRRAETILHSAGSNTVPSSLRGLHAWFSVMSAKSTRSLLAADPYAVLRYADITRLTDPDFKYLLSELAALSVRDPLFRSEDWGVHLGKALARDSAETEILALIQSEEVSYQLKTVILESIAGTAMAGRIRAHMKVLVRNEKATYVERLRAAEAVLEDAPDNDHVSLMASLLKSGSHDSIRLALEICCMRPSAHGGSQIATAVIAYDKQPDDRHILGIGWGLVSKLTPPQLIEFLGQIAPAVPKDQDINTRYSRELEEKLLEALRAYLPNNEAPTARQLWRWISRLGRRSHRHDDWNAFSNEYFDSRIQLRRAIQSIALTQDSAWNACFNLQRIASGVAFREDDLIYHMKALVETNRRPPKWGQTWFSLFRWAMINGNFTGQALEFGRAQAKGTPALQKLLEEFDNQPEPKWQIEHREFERREQAKHMAIVRVRHQSYSPILGEIARGAHLSALHQISSAYIGLFYDINKDGSPAERVRELVGDQNYDAAMRGLRSTKERSEFPTVREIAELHANQSKHFFLEFICIVACAIHVAEGGNISDLPESMLLTALSGFQWGLFQTKGEIFQELEAQLQTAIFADPTRKENFLRDSLEPFFEKSHTSVSGLYAVTHDNQFRDVVGKLAVDWLKRFSNLTAEPLEYLIDAAVELSPASELVPLIDHALGHQAGWSYQQREIWYGAAFRADFERFKDVIVPFGAESPDRISAFMQSFRAGNEVTASESPAQDVARLKYVLETFASSFPLTPSPGSGWGEPREYSRSQFIAGILNQLASIPTAAAREALADLISKNQLSNHVERARHLLAEQERQIAELSWSRRTLDDVRAVLQGGKPCTIDDFQSLIMDELVVLQRELQDGVTEAVEPFWNDKVPHDENYCRNRIIDGLRHRLEQYQIRLHAESIMPDNNRCDILCTCDSMDIPIEIKGQWHDRVWSAAADQLEDNYTRQYRADGRGIYVVLWFGRTGGYNPPLLGGKAKPNASTEMQKLLVEFSPRPISNLTRLFVLDISRPISSTRKTGSSKGKRLRKARRSGKS